MCKRSKQPQWTIKEGFTPIPVGAIVKVIKANDEPWHLGSLWEVTGYKNYTRDSTEINSITQLVVKSWPTERFFCRNEYFPWCVEVVEQIEEVKKQLLISPINR